MALIFKKLDEDEYMLALRQNHEEWGSELSLNEYFKKEKFCRQFQIILPFGLIKNGELVGSLEAYVRKSITNNICEDVWTIASVFVPKQHRKKGFGSKLFKEFAKIMDASNIKSVLFSDIQHFYKKFDYRTLECQACILDGRNFNRNIYFLRLGDLPVISRYNVKNCIDFRIMDDSNLYGFPFSRELFYRSNIIKPECSIDELNSTWNDQCRKKTLNVTMNVEESHYNHDLIHFNTKSKPILIDMGIGAYIALKDGSFGYIIWTCHVHLKPYTEDVSVELIQDYKHLSVISLQINAQSRNSKQQLERELLESAQQYAYTQNINKVVMWAFEYPHLRNAKLKDSWPAIRPADLKWKDIMRYTWC
eukprot:NODE_982_length_2555_cov_0.594055.p1 type:complete len:363 gc:universal NODE_982_length_2555_cov_0.594055:313-1401(+)